MRKIFVLAFVVLALSLLAACQVNVTDDDGLPPGLEIRNASYETDTQAQVDGVTQYVICNNRPTEFTYSFTFDGNLDTWESYLKGVETERIAGRQSFNLRSPFVDYDPATGRVTVNYEIRPNAAPQAIVVNPKVIGATQLFLDFGAYTYPLLSKAVPILERCS